jgi:chaperonin GroEL
MIRSSIRFNSLLVGPRRLASK